MSFRFKKAVSIIAIASFGYLGLAQCWGKFPLMRGLHNIGEQITNKWVRAIVFLLVFWWGWIVVAIAFLFDVIIFNLVEFWTGKNPISYNDFDANGEHRRIAQKGDEKAIFLYKDYGRVLEISVSKKDKHIKTMVAYKNEPGVLYVRTANGLERLSADVVRTEKGFTVGVREGSRLVVQKTLTQGEYNRMAHKVTEIAKAAEGKLQLATATAQ